MGTEVTHRIPGDAEYVVLGSRTPAGDIQKYASIYVVIDVSGDRMRCSSNTTFISLTSRVRHDPFRLAYTHSELLMLTYHDFPHIPKRSSGDVEIASIDTEQITNAVRCVSPIGKTIRVNSKHVYMTTSGLIDRNASSYKLAYAFCEDV